MAEVVQEGLVANRMSNYEEYYAKISEAKEKANRESKNVMQCEKEIEHNILRQKELIHVAHNTPAILENYDDEFERITKIEKRDMPILFLGVALHVARQTLQPKLQLDKVFETVSREDRHSSQDDGNKEKKKAKEQADKAPDDKSKETEYPNIKEILLFPVPYDAMKGTERIVVPGVSEYGKQLYAGNHHSATLGHDPVLGYIFGVANILTRTVSFKNPTFQTCHVELDERAKINPAKYAGQTVTYDVNMQNFLSDAISSCREDKNRLPAAITKQVLHFQSDKYCKIGLPIPFLSADIAQDLLKMDWNSYELERLNGFLKKTVLEPAAKQAVMSCVVNVIIEVIHRLCYDKNGNISLEVYKAKTHRIIETANIISTVFNDIATKLSLNPNYFDLGGFCTTIYRIAADEDVISRIKKEYVCNSYYNIVANI